MYDAPATTMALGASSAETPSPEETSTASSEASPEREASAQASATRSDGRGANATPEQEVSASAAAVDRRKKPQSVERGTSKRFLLELNPYSILIGRYSLTGEYLVTNEHAIVATAYAVYKGMDQVTTDGLPPGRFAYGADVMLTAIGGEIGYRYYPFSERARPYLGASVLVGRYVWSGQDKAGANVEAATMSVGGALDVGVQFVVGPGVVLGGGLGVSYTSADESAAPASKFGAGGLSTVSSSFASFPIRGLSPRLLFAVGYAF